MDNLKELIKTQKELEKEINSFEFPLLHIQTIKRDNLIKKLKEIKFKIFILKNKK